MKNISIDEPCTENWSKMTPTEKGAFCQKCSIDVIDFTEKSPDEVKSILRETDGKHVCGHFGVEQLEGLNGGYSHWQGQSRGTFQSKFLYALILVFGMNLFSYGQQEQELIMTLGQVRVDWSEEDDTTDSLEEFASSVLCAQDDESILSTEMKGQTAWSGEWVEEGPEQEGQVAKGGINASQLIDETMDKELIARNLRKSLSSIENFAANIRAALIANYLTDVPPNRYVVEANRASELIWNFGWTDLTSENHSYLTVGGAVTYFIADENLSLLTAHEIMAHEKIHEAELAETEIGNIDLFETKLFPNPTRDRATLVVFVKEAAQFDIQLYNMSGQMILEIHRGELQDGEQRFDIEMYDFTLGMYLARIVSGEQAETVKIQKH
ncbi:T9SS type A sorting domain-containing protein [Crocinitomix catalasitica]|nr:T9SS type A sorting domain-containing protein [Crocinitomix catalasitica]